MKKIDILDFGPGWLSVDKPAGISVHNDAADDLRSLVRAAVRENGQLRQTTGMDPDFGVNPVHRLDRGTSGVVLLAVNRGAFQYISRQFESRAVRKHYTALLHGNLKNPKPGDAWGLWRGPLSKSAGGRKNPSGTGKRVPCETRYRVLGHSAHYTMLEARLHSGRIHQIRRHAKLAGHPVVGDERYGSTRAVRYLKNHHDFERLALHAGMLTLKTEPGKKPVTMETGKIPDSMTALFENDRISIQTIDPRLPEILDLIRELDTYQASLYPPESNHLVEVEKLAGKAYYFIAALEEERPLAIASFKREAGYVEIKRLYVPKPYRGRNLAVKLMTALQKTAASEGYREARLETGIRQHEAIALYEKLGYEKTGPFGSYLEDPLSVFMRKKL